MLRWRVLQSRARRTSGARLRPFPTRSGGLRRSSGLPPPPPDHEVPQKANFDRDILQPASRGQLTAKHGSGIPSLAGRTSKASLTPLGGRGGHRGPPPEDLEDIVIVNGDDDNNSGGYGGGGRGGSSAGGGAADALRYVQQDYDPYFAFELMDDKKYYWREEEFESLVDDMDEAEIFGADGKGVFEVEYTRKSMAQRQLWDPSLNQHLEELSRELEAGGGGAVPDVLDVVEGEEEDEGSGGGGGHENEQRSRPDRRGNFRHDGMDVEQWFFQGSSDILEAAARDDLPEHEDSFGPSEEDRKLVLPLAPHGSGVDGFLQAMHEHPTDYAQVSLLKPHPAGLREPKPDFPKYRQPHPPLEFLEAHARFLYVTGLPPLTVSGEEGDLENPVHRSFLEKQVARLASVDSTQVWPVNRTSAFVGFFTPRSMANALAAGPSEAVLSKVPRVSLLSEEEGATNPFTDTEADRVLQLDYFPSGHSPSSLVSALFPPGSELETAYASSLASASDVYFKSSTCVLVRLASAEQAASAASSRIVAERLAEVGLYPVRYFMARRELVHAGFTGPVKDDEVRVMGTRLVVDGDMPSKEFFQSHARLLHVRNLDPAGATPEALTEAFAPFSELPRQTGSIERVTCHAGLPTDKAYVGFDTPGEAEACVRACRGGRLKMGDRWVVLRLVQDRIIPHKALYRAEKRPARPTEELWDDLQNWEKYVDPADVAYLEENGVPKVILDEALTRIRRSNPTFGPLDRALRSEALEPETSQGDLYRDLVVLYVQTLKDCVATPENVGDLYEAIHLPDEPIDLSIFDDWDKRKAEMEQTRARP